MFSGWNADSRLISKLEKWDVKNLVCWYSACYKSHATRDDEMEGGVTKSLWYPNQVWKFLFMCICKLVSSMGSCIIHWKIRALIKINIVWGRREQYYWVRYWYWVILGCFATIGIGIGIVRGFSKYWYWYSVLLRAFQSIGIGIGYC